MRGRCGVSSRSPLESKVLKQTNLILFFTLGISLRTWERLGLLSRELAIYKSLLPHLREVSFLTYGDDEDLSVGGVDGFKVLCNRWGVGATAFSVLAPWYHRKELKRAKVFKTNQINGSWTAVIAKYLFRKKLIVRCGYLWSVHNRIQTTDARSDWLVRLLEGMACKAADRIVVTSSQDKRYILDRYGISDEKITVIPNYVDTERFKPLSTVQREPGLLCFVGRLEEQKNGLALLEAVKSLPGVRLQIIGSGGQRGLWEEKARESRAQVEFLGNLPHDDLPAVLNRATAFVLPSLYEGHPKALVEAMACGLPVIGTDVRGIRDFIRHRETGYLCRTSPSDIREAIEIVLSDAHLRRTLGERAREFVVENFSLDRVLELETELLGSLEG